METTEPTPLDYQTPGPKPRRLFSATAFVAALILHLLLVLDLAVVVPRFESFFWDFGAKLPAVSQILIDTSAWFRKSGWIVLLPTPIVVGLLAGILSKPAVDDAQRKARVRWTFRIATLVLFLILGLTAFAMLVPSINLINAISGK